MIRNNYICFYLTADWQLTKKSTKLRILRYRIVSAVLTDVLAYWMFHQCNVCVRMHAYVSDCVLVCVCVRACMLVCACVCVFVCVCACVRAHACLCVRACACVRLCPCMSSGVCIASCITFHTQISVMNLILWNFVEGGNSRNPGNKAEKNVEVCQLTNCYQRGDGNCHHSYGGCG